MGMKYLKFEPCPECSESEYPNIYHGVIYSVEDGPAKQTFYAKCTTCGYESEQYNRVVELVAAWNANSIKVWPPITNKRE